MIGLSDNNNILGIGVMSNRVWKFSECIRELLQKIPHKRTGGVTTGSWLFVLTGLEETSIPTLFKKTPDYWEFE